MLTKKYEPEVLNYIRSYDVKESQIRIEIATQTARVKKYEDMILFDPRGVAATRRRFLGQVGFAGLAMAATPVWAEKVVKLPLPGGPEERPLTTDFPQKGPMILQRTRPPLLETPFEVFDRACSRPTTSFLCAGTGRSSPTRSMSRRSGSRCAAMSTDAVAVVE